jgi:hypothetical protein
VDEQSLTPEELLNALHDLVVRWETRATEATRRAAARRPDSFHEPYYYRGIAKGLLLAADDLRALLEPATAQAEMTAEAPEVVYAQVGEQEALDFLKRAGLSVSTLYRHKDNSFSAIFPKLPPLSLEERIARLTAGSNAVIILGSGRLSDSARPFIDFAFSSPPQAEE